MRQPRPRSRPIFGRGGGGRGSFAAASGGGSGMLESSGLALLGPNELAGMAADFTTPAGSVYVRDPFTAANNVNTDRSWFTQSGTSPKLVRDGSGTYVWAGHNISRFSETFDDASWSKVAGSIVASATLPPSGYAKADKYVEDGTNAQHFVSKTEAGFIVGLPYTVTARLKPSGRTWCRFQFVNNFYFNMSGAGSVGTVSGGSGTITALADGWYLVTYTNTPSSTSTTGYIFAQTADNETSYTGDGASGFFVSGYQINRGSVPTAYVPTTTAAVYTLAQDYDPTLGWGLLVEPAATNLCLQSQDFTTTWVNTNTDEPTTNNADPFGGTTADEIAATATANQAFAIYQGFTGLTAANTATCSVFAKVGTNATMIQLAWDSDGSGADGCFCNFNLSTGAKGTVTALAAGTATAAYIEAAANGFYRCTLVGKIAAGTVGRFTISIVDLITEAVFGAANLADNDSVILFQAQVEATASSASTVATSPIPTTTVSVTRAADKPNYLISRTPWSTGVGTFIVTYVPFDKDATHRIFGGTSGGAESFPTTYDVAATGVVHFGMRGVNDLLDTANSVVLSSINKMGLVMKGGDSALVLNGGTVVTSATAYTIKAATTEFMALGYEYDAGTQQLNGYIKSFVYLPRRMSNAELMSRTA